MFYNCNPCSLLSFHTTCYVLLNCACLQNVAFPPDAVIGDDIFIDKEAPMYGSSGAVFHHSNATIMWEIWHRFDELVVRTTYPQLCLLPVLSSGGVTYPHCCNKHGSSQCQILRRKLNPMDNQQDCLGITPLHILTCSSVHDLEVYRLIVENYPANLITQDKWDRYCMHSGGLCQLR